MKAMADPERERLAARLLKARRERGLTQAAAGKIMGVGPSAVANWERCRSFPTGQLYTAVFDFIGGKI